MLARRVREDWRGSGRGSSISVSEDSGEWVREGAEERGLSSWEGSVGMQCEVVGVRRGRGRVVVDIVGMMAGVGVSSMYE